MKTKTIATPYSLSHYDLEGELPAILRQIHEEFDRANKWALAQYPWLEDVGYSIFADWEPPTFGVGETLTLYLKRPETPEETERREALQNITAEDLRERDLDMLRQLVRRYPEDAKLLIK